MVPFTFENISRPANHDAPNAPPVSAAARATHDSFESHLQRAGTTPVDPPKPGPTRRDEPPARSKSPAAEPPRNEPPRNEPPQNEPSGQDAGEASREEGGVRNTEDAEATAAAEKPAERHEEQVEDVERGKLDAVSAAEAVIAKTANEAAVAIQDAQPAASNESNDDSDREVATQIGRAPVADKELERNARLATRTEVPAGDEIPASGDAGDGTVVDREGNLARGERVTPAHVENPTGQTKPSETEQEVAERVLPAAVPGPATTNPEAAPSHTSSSPRRRTHRDDLSPSQPTPETLAAAPQPAAVDVVETAAETANEERSRQSQHHFDADAPQAASKPAAAEAATSASGTPSRFAQHLLARAEDPNARGLTITHADQARFVDRVARAVQATGEREGTLRLRLSPPELGSLTLEVKVQGGSVSARVEADTPAARTLLLENLPTLRERLAEHGMRVEQFDVDLSDRQAGGTPDGLQQHDQQHESRPRAKSASREPDNAPQAITDTSIKNGNEQLNIIV